MRALAQALDLPFRRIQFTPDLLPADLTGTQIYRPATGTFDVRPGPIVTSVLLADEINRAPAKVQSALLEAMQEGQITVGDETLVLPETFWVLATQNPIEHEGTYPLPEAQLDRFLMKLVVGYPDRAAELAMLDLPSVAETSHAETWTGDEPALFGPADVLAFRKLTASIRVAPAIKEYVVDLVRATRDPAAYGLGLAPLLELGASPRATIALIRAARGHALLSRSRLRDPARRQDPGPRRHAAPHHDQLRGRRRGPLRRRHPRPDPRPHPGAVSRSEIQSLRRARDGLGRSGRGLGHALRGDRLDQHPLGLSACRRRGDIVLLAELADEFRGRGDAE